MLALIALGLAITAYTFVVAKVVPVLIIIGLLAVSVVIPQIALAVLLGFSVGKGIILKLIISAVILAAEMFLSQYRKSGKAVLMADSCLLSNIVVWTGVSLLNSFFDKTLSLENPLLAVPVLVFAVLIYASNATIAGNDSQAEMSLPLIENVACGVCYGFCTAVFAHILTGNGLTAMTSLIIIAVVATVTAVTGFARPKH